MGAQPHQFLINGRLIRKNRTFGQNPVFIQRNFVVLQDRTQARFQPGAVICRVVFRPFFHSRRQLLQLLLFFQKILLQVFPFIFPALQEHGNRLVKDRTNVAPGLFIVLFTVSKGKNIPVFRNLHHRNIVRKGKFVPQLPQSGNVAGRIGRIQRNSGGFVLQNIHRNKNIDLSP